MPLLWRKKITSSSACLITWKAALQLFIRTFLRFWCPMLSNTQTYLKFYKTCRSICPRKPRYKLSFSKSMISYTRCASETPRELSFRKIRSRKLAGMKFKSEGRRTVKSRSRHNLTKFCWKIQMLWSWVIVTSGSP